ncbi:very-long-chain (3R)-3-hydroxyacyl-CoA dehydratase PASTICCINO 2-like [Andrographis paniculata]|uniref:very-long-chain (3R)-3-hydroxyacyl-CoA dehydratase PASTICCINO 2-like n=1 Tax=Andrographis paniculata TaxID=175694 RepID=UPI0021E78E34|nr:very-long-chain (3R)-3-hydroxyacyl-CoA dehydratase PASTICCINO 2-like [Andrographis paniculata]
MAGTLISSVRRIYLAVYNFTVLLGWIQVLYLTLKALTQSQSQSRPRSSVYAAVEKPLVLAQSAAAIEIAHSIAGIVRSPVLATLPQVSSRLYVVWEILRGVPEIRGNYLVVSLLLSWSVTEIVRYAYFAAREAVGWTPPWLQWLRYTTFLVLYPTGISSEVGLIYRALPHLHQSVGNYRNVLAIFALCLYAPGSPFLYGYMLGQRKKAFAQTKPKLD